MPNRRAFIGTSTVAAAGLMVDWRRVWAQAAKGVPGATVETTAGKVRGLVVDKIHAFKGLRYGESTAGARRFLAPVKVQPWTGVRDATRPGNECVRRPCSGAPAHRRAGTRTACT